MQDPDPDLKPKLPSKSDPEPKTSFQIHNAGFESIPENNQKSRIRMFVVKVVNEKKEEVELCSSVECKGIIGNDGRHYILDLLRYLSSSNTLTFKQLSKVSDPDPA